MPKKQFLPIILIFLALILIGCLQEKPRSYLAADGIIVGQPKSAGGREVFVPISLKTAIINSAHLMHDVKWTEKEGVIYITAVVNVPPFSKKKDYPGGITLKDPEGEMYELKYKDPEGNIHDIGKIKMP